MAQDNSGKLLWFVAGAAIGSTLALLYAPQPGHRTRRMIGQKAREAGDTVLDSSRDFMDKGRDLFEKGRRVADDAADLIERGRKLVEG